MVITMAVAGITMVTMAVAGTTMAVVEMEMAKHRRMYGFAVLFNVNSDMAQYAWDDIWSEENSVLTPKGPRTPDH